MSNKGSSLGLIQKSKKNQNISRGFWLPNLKPIQTKQVCLDKMGTCVIVPHDAWVALLYFDTMPKC